MKIPFEIWVRNTRPEPNPSGAGLSAAVAQRRVQRPILDARRLQEVKETILRKMRFQAGGDTAASV